MERLNKLIDSQNRPCLSFKYSIQNDSSSGGGNPTRVAAEVNALPEYIRILFYCPDPTPSV